MGAMWAILVDIATAPSPRALFIQHRPEHLHMTWELQVKAISEFAHSSITKVRKKLLRSRHATLPVRLDYANLRKFSAYACFIIMI
jgi:hypothetical protein